MSLLRLENLSKKFTIEQSSVKVLKQISFEIKENEFVGIYGVSGSGKTTLLNILGLIDLEYEGDLLIEERSINNLKNDERTKLRNEYFGYLHQSFGLLNDFTVYENVEFPLIIKEKQEKARQRRILKVLHQLEIFEKKDSYPYLLSGGQAQRVALARSIVNSPKIILTDEPTASLDTLTGLSIVRLLRKLVDSQDLSHSVIMVTHDEAFKTFFDRIYYLENGNLIEGDKH